MTCIKHLGLFAAIALTGTFAGGLAAEAKSSCVRAGGEATMITADLTRFMANAALKNSISGMGAKPAGQISMTCAPNMGLTSCKAFQRACK